MSKAWAKGSTRAWRRLRARILTNNLLPPPRGNSGLCTLQVPDVCTGQATQVHHELGKANGDDERYLKPVCKACNLHIGDPTRYNPQPRVMTRW